MTWDSATDDSLPLGFGLTSSTHEPETVLVAEEDDELREEIVAELSGRGLRVIEVEDGLELEDYLVASQVPGTQLYRPSLLVLDAQMPGVSGLDIVRHLRDSGQLTPFILITGPGDSEAFEEAELLGAEYVVEKPFD
jgi:CheY-like chemotaxis protein